MEFEEWLLEYFQMSIEMFEALNDKTRQAIKDEYNCEFATTNSTLHV